MPALDRITPVVLTYNEEANIGRTLARLEWAENVLVVDSGSGDGTCEIVRSFPNATLMERTFTTHRDQWNFAIAQVETPWVLTLDADYQVPPRLVEEISRIPDRPGVNGFHARFHLRVLGKVLERTLYPPKQVLFRPAHARFEQDGDTERVVVRGGSGFLRTPIVHDDRKSLSRWLENQGRYAENAALALTSTSWSELSVPDRVRRTRFLGPAAVLVYCLFWKGLVFEGWPGWYYTLERVTAEALNSMALLRMDFGRTDSSARAKKDEGDAAPSGYRGSSAP